MQSLLDVMEKIPRRIAFIRTFMTIKLSQLLQSSILNNFWRNYLLCRGCIWSCHTCGKAFVHSTDVTFEVILGFERNFTFNTPDGGHFVINSRVLCLDMFSHIIIIVRKFYIAIFTFVKLHLWNMFSRSRSLGLVL